MANERVKRMQRLEVGGMKCERCVTQVEQALRALAGVEEVKVSLNEGTASIVGDVEAEDLLRALSKTNYQARPLKDE